MNFSKILRQKRLEAGFTLEELAKQIGTSKQTVQRYETGAIANVPPEKIELLALALDTTPAILMGWETKSVPKEKYDLSLDNIYLSLAKEAETEKIHPDDIRLAIDFIKRTRGDKK